MAVYLFENLTKKNRLRILDLSYNLISSFACESLSVCLENNSLLEELYLQMNKINGFGGVQLFSSL
jgi:Leucine-rich repeat (LRR) protein